MRNNTYTRVHGSYADTVKVKRGARPDKKCGMCGSPIPMRKTFCGPCYDIRLQTKIQAGRERRKRKDAIID